MRANVDAREANQDGNRETRKSDSATREDQNGKECGRCDNVSGGKRVILGTQARSIPSVLGFHRWPGPAGGNLDRAAGDAGNRQRNQHCHENADPFLVSAPPRDTGKNKSEGEMFQPIATLAHVAHEIADTWILMIRNEIANGIIEIERRCDYDRGNRDPDEPVKNSAALHNTVSVRFAGRYFEAPREINQLRVAVFGMPAFSCRRDMERSPDRPRRAALRRSVPRDD